jgi:uncharacterized RDD family membrane protein YckC
MAIEGLEPAPAPQVVEAAPWGRRFGAWIIDSIITGIPTSVYIFSKMMREFAAAGIFESSAPPTPDDISRITNRVMDDLLLIGLISTLIAAVYFVLLHGATGRTLGKMAVGIKVIKDDGSKCDFAAAFRRAVVYPIGGGVPWIGGIVTLLNGLWPLWDDKHQSLGDKLAGTYVVRKDPVVRNVPLATVTPQVPPPAV